MRTYQLICQILKCVLHLCERPVEGPCIPDIGLHGSAAQSLNLPANTLTTILQQNPLRIAFCVQISPGGGSIFLGQDSQSVMNFNIIQTWEASFPQFLQFDSNKYPQWVQGPIYAASGAAGGLITVIESFRLP